MNRQPIAKFTIYYRKDIPSILVEIVSHDGHISLHKDGVKKMSAEHKAPRATLVVGDNGEYDQAKRIKKLVSILETLEANNQIVGFKRV